jgi:small subunit ribosomal protein S8
MLTRLRNAVSAKHTRVDMPASRLKADIARILQDEGYIQGFKLLDDGNGEVAPVKTLRVFLKYGPKGERIITGIERIMRPAAASISGARRRHAGHRSRASGTSIHVDFAGVTGGPRSGRVGAGSRCTASGRSERRRLKANMSLAETDHDSQGRRQVDERLD